MISVVTGVGGDAEEFVWKMAGSLPVTKRAAKKLCACLLRGHKSYVIN